MPTYKIVLLMVSLFLCGVLFAGVLVWIKYRKRRKANNAQEKLIDKENDIDTLTGLFLR